MEKHFEFSFKSLDRDTIILFVLFFIANFGLQTVTRYLEVYIIDLGYSARELGTFVLVTGIVGIFANFVVLPNIYKLWPDRRSLRYILLISSVTLAASFYFFDHVMTGLYSIFMIYVLARSMYDPLHNSVLSKQTEEHQGQLIGLSESFKTLGMFLGPILGGFIYAWNEVGLFYIVSGILMVGFVIGRFFVGKI